MGLTIVRVIARSDRPRQLVVVYNEPVLQVDPANSNDSLNPANYSIHDENSVAFPIYSIVADGPTAVSITTDPQALRTTYSLSVVNVEAVNGDIIPSPRQTISIVGRVSSTPAVGTPAVTSAGPPILPAPWYRVELGHVWQDVAGTVPAVNDNDPIGRIDDQSGNGFHMIQATAGFRPLLKLGIQNGKPAALFDGVDDFLAAVCTPFLDSAFVVAKNASVAFPSYSGCFTDQSASDNDIMFTGNNGTKDWYNGGRFSSDFNDSMHVDVVPTWRMTELNDAHATIGLAPNYHFRALVALQLGKDRGYAGRFWGGYIMEAGAFPAVLTLDDMESFATYFEGYWGIVCGGGVFDNFVRANGPVFKPPRGGAYVGDLAQWQVDTNLLKCTSGGSSVFLLSNSENVDATWRLRIANNSGGSDWALIFRSNGIDSSDCWLLHYDGTHLSFYNHAGGYLLIAQVVQNVVAGDELEVVTLGTSIKAYLNGVHLPGLDTISGFQVGGTAIGVYAGTGFGAKRWSLLKKDQDPP
jgi:hypothetical protein